MIDANDKISVIGIPFDENSSFKRGAANAPKAIRESLNSYSTNLSTETGLDLKISPNWIDAGDIKFSREKSYFNQIEKIVEKTLENESRVIALGGDHSITYPIVSAYAKKYNNLTILHLDAHPDLYDELDGNRYSHACPFARIMEEGLAVRLVQLGIRTINPHQREQINKFGVETIEMKDWNPEQNLILKSPVYLSLDIDALDPAFAPGVSHIEPGGFSTREVIQIIQDLDIQLVGADIVELNPSCDPNGITAMTAAKFLKEILANMIKV